MSLSRLATFHRHYLKNCSIISVLIFFNFFLQFSHQLSFSINQFDGVATNILYEGDAVPSLLGVIELTTISNQTFRIGRATYAEPFRLWDSANGSLSGFTTNFSFVVDTLNQTQFADGLVFFLAPDDYPIPVDSAGAGLGLLSEANYFAVNTNHIVMVEFDAHSNPRWDPPGPHVGINVNTIISNVNTSWDASGNSGKVANVQITYNAAAKNLSVFWMYHEVNPAHSTNYAGNLNYSLSYLIDLRDVLPERVKIGFSASTGIYNERHAIYSWDFSSSLDSTVDKEKKKGRRRRTIFFIEVVGVPFFILMLGLTISCWLVTKKWPRTRSIASFDSTGLERRAFPRRFAYRELVAATNGCADHTRLGHGGSGQVYRGVLRDPGCTRVAVKRIFAEPDHHQYEKVFINEVNVISRLIHRNVVQFIGWCHEQGECLLVYAYMPNGSLDTHLFGRRTILQWDFRYKIALGLASSLHYLHEDAEQCVLHRDIKSANVLLDNNFNTKLGDFGIAKLVDPQFHSKTHHTTRVAGTVGYIAPEYAAHGRASKESDMFSFGVVALEIACGRRYYHDGEYIVPLFGWVWQHYLEGNLLDVADERLETNFDRNEMECLLTVGLWCTHPDKKERPQAGQVMKVLQIEAPFPELPPDMHDHPPPQPQQEADLSSYASLTSSLKAVGR